MSNNYIRTDKSIAILLSTYNSETYLSELLESLYGQTCQDFCVYVHDDGSTDATLEILKSYQQKHGRLNVMHDDCPGRGANGSFVWLLERVEAAYYMFCDHDDVWLPQKIEKSLSLLKKCEERFPSKPAVVNTDLKVVDQRLNELHPSFWKYSGICRPLLNDFDYLTVYNAFNGCSMIFNRIARDISLPVSEKSLMHDKWVALNVASEDGCLDYVDEPLILYRQHSDNEVGALRVDGRYYRLRLLSFGGTLRNMKADIEMSRAIRPYSWPRYFYFKCLYYIKRFLWYLSA